MISKLVSEIQNLRLQMISVGRLLAEAKENSWWMAEIGAGIDTWYDFVAQPEIGLSVSEANFLVQLGGMSSVCSDGELSRVPTATVKYILKHGGDIMDAQLLSTKDFKRKYFEDRHEGKDPSFKYMVMKVMEDGTMEKVHNLESDEILERIKDKLDNNG